MCPDQHPSVDGVVRFLQIDEAHVLMKFNLSSMLLQSAYDDESRTVPRGEPLRPLSTVVVEAERDGFQQHFTSMGYDH